MDQGFEVAVEDAIDVADGQLGAVILDHAIGGEHIAANLVAEVDVELGVLQFLVGGLLLLHFVLVETGAELLDSAGAVLVLRTLVLALDDDAGGDVGHAHSRLRAIHVLAAGAAGAEDVDAKVFGLDIDVDVVFDLRVDEDGREGSMASRVGVEGRDADEAMDADFRLQQSVGIFAVDFDGGGFDAGAFAVEAIGNDGAEAVTLSPAQIHAQKHLGPVLALGAAGTGVDGHDGALGIVLAGEQHGGFERFHALGEGLQLAFDIGEDVFAFAGELEQRVQIRSEAHEAGFVGDGLLQALAILHDLLGFFGLIPEVRIGDLLFGFG